MRGKGVWGAGSERSLTSSMVRGRGIKRNWAHSLLSMHASFSHFTHHTLHVTRHSSQASAITCSSTCLLKSSPLWMTSSRFTPHIRFLRITSHISRITSWQDLLSSHPSHGANCAAVAAATETSAQQPIQEPVKHSSPPPVPPRSRSKLFLNSPQPPPRQYVGDSCTGADLAGTDDTAQCIDDPPAPPPPAPNSARTRRQPPLLHTIQPSQLKILHKIGTFSRTHHSCALYTRNPFEIAKCLNCVSQYCTV
jgi:hypothetical protein